MEFEVVFFLIWKTYEIDNFTLPALNSENMDTIEEMYGEYLNDIEVNANIRTSTGESKYNVDTFKEYKIVRSKSIIDKIEDYIGPLYGLTLEEIDFIKNYELEFRMAESKNHQLYNFTPEEIEIIER